MKKTLTTLLMMAMMCCHQVLAEQALLPYGQLSKEAWSAKYLYEQNTSAVPDGEWYAENYDDSAWGTLEGPISNTSNVYYNTEWKDDYSSYWLRRYFDVESLDRVNTVYLYVYHDDGCTLYLNGTEIYSYDGYLYNGNPAIVALTPEQQALLHTGQNVVAVQVRGTYGDNFIDFGLYGYDAPRIVNPQFNQYYDGWVRTGDDLSRGGLDENYVMRSGNNRYGYDMYQDLPSAKKGLYRLRVQAFQMVGSDNQSWYWYGKQPVQAKIYMGQEESPIKNIYDEAVYENFYRQGEFITTGEGSFVPDYATSTSLAFNRGMYENTLFAYNDKDTLRIGIRFIETGWNQWTCFDNFRLDYVNEADIAEVEEKLPQLKGLPMPEGYRAQVVAMLDELKTAADYEAKSRVIVKYSDIYDDALAAVDNYDALAKRAQQLQDKVDNAEKAAPTTVEEASALIAQAGKGLKDGSLSNRDCKRLMNEMDKISLRLEYVFLAFDVQVPGSLGDSILSKVEYFSDVKSLKVSGTLNDADLSTIRERLTSLCEIDMSGLKMTNLPNQLFYEHKIIEKVILPSSLVSIGEYAFYRCYALEHIDFPASLQTINRYAFQECTNLREVVLPEGLTALGDGAFYHCDRCTYLKLPTTLQTIPNSAFAYNYNLKEIDFAEGLVNINNSAFYDNYNLTSLKFPTTLHFIGSSAFAYNFTLSEVKFNEGLYQLADNSFYDCDALTEITLPSSLVLANSSPFDYCDNLRKVTCLSIEPPYMTDQIPYGMDMEGRELYVPALSLNNYKQSTGWDKFPIIKPIDYLPENITVVSDFHLTLPEGLTTEYKPNVSLIHDQKGSYYWQYGALTVNGEGTLSMSNFSMFWDPNYAYGNSNRNSHYCSLVNNSHLRADNVQIDIYTRNDRWTFMAMPFDVKVSDIVPFETGTTNWVIRKYDGQARAAGETDKTWVRLTADDEIKAGEGFIIQGSRYVNNSWQEGSGYTMKAINNGNKNNLFQTTDITVALNDYPSAFTHNRSWNFIGNPYPSYYDTRFMEYSAPITVWDIYNGNYKAYSPADDAYILSPGEAFFVQRPVAAGEIVFGKDGRQTTREARTIEEAAGARAESANVRTIVNLTLTDGQQTDQTRIVLNDMASANYEMDKDASKFMSLDANAPQLFSTYSNTDYAINERPVADGVVTLSMRIGRSGSHTIALANSMHGYKVVLEDQLTGKTVVLTDGEYTFTANAGNYPGRFLVRFVGEATGIDFAETETLKNEPVYDLTGRRTTTQKKGVYVQKGKKFMSNK